MYAKINYCFYNQQQQLMTTTEILNFLKQHREKLRQDFGVTKVGLFGSYARNEANESSDIDIAVEIESNNSFRSYFNLLYFLEDGLQKKVDLGIEHSIKPIAKKTMLKEIIYVK